MTEPKIRSGVTKRVLADLERLAQDDEAAFATFWGQFGAVLKEAMSGVLDAGRKSDAQSVAMAQGKANVMDVVTAVAETDVAVSTLVSVRDKVIQAYEDILRMPI